MIRWDGAWGEMPSESAHWHMAMADILPQGSTSALGSISVSSKRKGKCLDLNLDLDGATQGLSSEDGSIPGEHAPSTEFHSAGSWNGLTRTLRSIAVSVKALGRDSAQNKASISRIGTEAPSSSSEDSRSKGKKRQREDEDEGEGKKEKMLYDSNDEWTF
jgi:hypothetical protein